MRKSILVALSLLVSSFAFAAPQASSVAQPAEVKWECENPYGTKTLCENYHFFKLKCANPLIQKLRLEGYNYAAGRLIEMRDDMGWGLKYAQAGNKRQAREFLPAATEGMSNLKFDTKKARKKHAEVKRLYKVCAKGADYYDYSMKVWLGDIDDSDDSDDSDDHDDSDDSDDHDDADDSDDHDDSDDSDDHDDMDDFDDDNEADDSDDHDDDADDFDDDNEIDEF